MYSEYVIILLGLAIIFFIIGGVDRIVSAINDRIKDLEQKINELKYGKEYADSLKEVEDE